MTKLPGSPTVHECKISKSCFSVENKRTKPSYFPPGNVLWCAVVWGDIAVSLGLSVTMSFGHSLERAGVNKGSIRQLCLDHGLF